MTKAEKKDQKDASDAWPQTEEAFIAWFWEPGNEGTNELIRKLNAYPGKHDFIRREKVTHRPVIYCIVLNDKKFSPITDEEHQWKMCKVGYTTCSTEEGTDNRMETVMKQINTKYKATHEREPKPDVIFKMSISAVDVSPFSETEERIRKAMGFPVEKELAKKYGLPCSTEWVLTTQDFISEIQTEKKKKLQKKEEVIDLFKDNKFETKYKGLEPPSWLSSKNEVDKIIEENKPTAGTSKSPK